MATVKLWLDNGTHLRKGLADRSLDSARIRGRVDGLEGTRFRKTAIEEARNSADYSALHDEIDDLPEVYADAWRLGPGVAGVVFQFGRNARTEPVGQAFNMARTRTFESLRFDRWKVVSVDRDGNRTVTDAPTETWFQLVELTEDADTLLYKRLRRQPSWLPVTRIDVDTFTSTNPDTVSDVIDRYDAINSDAVVINGATYPAQSLQFKGVEKRRVLTEDGVKDRFAYIFHHLVGGTWTSHKLEGPFFGCRVTGTFYAPNMDECDGEDVGFWWKIFVTPGQRRGRVFQDFDELVFANKFPIHDDGGFGPDAAA